MDIVFFHSTIGYDRVVRTIGAYQAAWYLREHGYDAQVINFCDKLSKDLTDKIINKFITEKTKVIGWSYMGYFKDFKPWAQVMLDYVIPRIKQLYPNIKIIVGGPYAYDMCSMMTNAKFIDRFFFGFSEDALLTYMNNLCRGGPRLPFDFMYGNKVSKEFHAVNTDKKFDICSLRHRWHKNDCIQQGESLPIETARGCIFKCKFCRTPNIGKTKNDYLRDMDEIRDEMIDNYNKFKTTNYYIMDETFNDSAEKVKMFCKMSSELPFKLRFWAHLRVDLLWANPGQAEMLRDAGLVSCFFGIESFHPEASKLVGKGWSAKHGKEYLLKLHNEIWKKEIIFRLGVIVGLPPETEQMCYETQQWMIDNDIPDWKWNGLNINRDENNPEKSEFDREHSKYGFRWESDGDDPNWKTDYMDFYTAAKISDQLNADAEKHKRINNWVIMERATLGYDIETDRYTREIDCNNDPSMKQKRDQFRNNYFSDLLKLEV